MFNNLVNAYDALRLIEKIRQGYLPRIWKSLTQKGTTNRVRLAWEHVVHPPKHWGNIPAVKDRWYERITGSRETSPPVYVARTYFSDAPPLTALSIGCGTGSNELRWARTGKFRIIDAFDVSEARIREAQRRAEAEDLGDVVKFQVADVLRLELTPRSYDVVLAENVLHHLAPVREAVHMLREALKPGGYLILRDFVGPSRFQWTRRQVEAVNGLLAILPNRYRRRWGSGSLKRRFHPPGRLSMTISDPSEAAESSRILPLLDAYFETVERRDLGGTVLHLLLDDIAHNFLADDEETMRWLNYCFETEDLLLATGELQSDFVFAIFRNRPAVA